MISVPGKVFIFGEYSVMNGGEALIAAVQPGFDCGWSNTTRIHPNSPAGKFLIENGTQVFTKVSGGLGSGFGSSTAELIAANDYLDHPWSIEKLWNWYREHFSPASGADLAVQSASRKMGAGTYHFQIHQPHFRLNQVIIPTEFKKNCFVFHTHVTQKIPTYSDLENKKDQAVDVAHADLHIHRWLKSFDPTLLSAWADYLAKQGYESLFAHEVRKAFAAIPGVIGVKGCGAGLNDVFLVCVDQTFPEKIQRAMSEVAVKYNLNPVGSLLDHV